MSFKELPLRSSYDSTEDDVLNDFYISVLSHCKEYRRLAGFFSSTALAVAARGIKGLIENDGKMKLIVSAYLSKRDVAAIQEGLEKPEEVIERLSIDSLQNIVDEFVRNHVSALAWMVANDRLEIKVCIVEGNDRLPLDAPSVMRNGIFHQKVGILSDDEDNILSFSGSVNESRSGWVGNIEEFKVFRSWHHAEGEYLEADIHKFDKLWNNESRRVKVIPVPKAIKDKLIAIAPKSIENIDFGKRPSKDERKIQLFQHQKEAIEKWTSVGMKGIFAMATGTGKTFTALGCLIEATKTHPNLLVIISCPYNHLVQQWKREIEKFGIEYDDLIIADSSNLHWKDKLAESLIDISLEYTNKVIAVTTHRTFSSEDFISIVRKNKGNSKVFLIADEVHGLGARKSRDGLIEEYGLRLGLSATPQRFDIVETNIIYDYFGGIIHEFKLEEAINTINPRTSETYLTPYRYLPKFVSLTSNEVEEYLNKTKAIVMKCSKAGDRAEKDEMLDLLTFSRANIIKNAARKFEVLNELLDEIEPDFRWTITYCSPQQIDSVRNGINRWKRERGRSISIHSFTMDEDPKPDVKYGGISERDDILNKFATGRYEMLVAMKCLDEGVDVPPARKAILMASSGNPREYIQRIGRIIRRYPGKSEATIYDIVVIPSFDSLPPELREIEWKIFQKEIKRYEEIAETAINNAEVLNLIYETKNKLREGKQ